jgi:large subunit ribosomal protein L15
MQIHQLRSSNKSSKKRKVGRGGKRGTYSGRGIKGQRSRAGSKIKSQVREMILKFPKRRGVSFNSLKEKSLAIQLKDIAKIFPDGAIITLKKIKKTNLINSKRKKFRSIKILGPIALSKKYIIKNCPVSEKVKEAIEKAGGKVDLKIK